MRKVRIGLRRSKAVRRYNSWVRLFRTMDIGCVKMAEVIFYNSWWSKILPITLNQYFQRSVLIC